MVTSAETAQVGQRAHVGLDQPQVDGVRLGPPPGQLEHRGRCVDADDR